MPEELKNGEPLETTKAESVPREGIWSWVKRNWNKGVVVVAICAGGVIMTMNQTDKTTTVCLKHPSFVEQVCVTITDTTSKEDSARLVYVVDSLNKEAKSQFCTDKKDYSKITYALSGAVPSYTKGETETVRELVDGNMMDVQKPIYYPIAVETSTDSTKVEWVKENQYEVVINRDLKEGYTGTFDGDMGKAFWVKYVIDANGKYRPALAMIDYKTSTYLVPGPLASGERIDPGYSVVSIGAGVSFLYQTGASTYRDSVVHFVDSTGMQHAYFFNDTDVNGITYDSGNATKANGQLKNGVTLSTGYNVIATACSLDGVNDTIDCGTNMNTIDATNKFTISFRVKFKSITAKVMFAKVFNATNYFYYVINADSTQSMHFGVAMVHTIASCPKMINPINNWRRVTIKYDGTGLNNADKVLFFVDGVQQTVSFAGTIPTATGNMAALRWGFGTALTEGVPFNGLLDDFRIYGIFRTPSQRITALHAELESYKKDTLYSKIAGQALVRIKAGNKQVDSVFIFKDTGDSLKFVLTSTVNDTTLNIRSVFNMDSTETDSLVVKTKVGNDTVRTFKDSVHVRNAGGVLDTLNFLYANNVGRVVAPLRYSPRYFNAYQRTYNTDTLFAPTFISITPSSGSTAGGTSVTITGTRFYSPRGTGSVTIGGNALTSYTSWVNGQIVGVTAAHDAGATDVIITNSNGLSVTATGAYTYTSPSTSGTIYSGNSSNFKMGFSIGF